MPLSITPGAGATLATKQVQSAEYQGVYIAQMQRIAFYATQISIASTVSTLVAPTTSAQYALIRPDPGQTVRWWTTPGATLSGSWGNLLVGVGSTSEAVEITGTQIANFRFCLNAGETAAGKLNVEFGYFIL